MPAINLGNFTTHGGKVVASGMGTGMNTHETIDELVKIRKMPINDIQDKIDYNTQKLAAFESLKTKIGVLKDKLDGLRGKTEVVNDKLQYTSIFDAKKVFLTSSDATKAAANYVGVSASSASEAGRINFRVDQLAKEQKILSQGFTTDNASVTEAAGGVTAGLFSAGTFSINGQNITITQGDTLQDIKNAINLTSAYSKVNATVVKIADNDYRLQIQSTEPGLANSFSIIDTNNETAQVTFTTTQAAQDASVVLDPNGGSPITVTRSTNTISDIFNGITLSLYQADNTLTLTSDIDYDRDAVKVAITEFMVAYQDVLLFSAKQTARNNEESYFDENMNFVKKDMFKEDAFLGNEYAIDYTLSGMVAELAALVANLDDDNDPMTSNSLPKSLADIGIFFENFPGDDENPKINNLLTFNTSGGMFTAFDDILISDYEKVRRVFEFHATSSAANFFVTHRTNGLNLPYNSSFTIDIDTGRAAGQEVIIGYQDEDNVTQNIYADFESQASGGVIRGKIGQPIEGLEIRYVGGGVDTGVINEITQGVADRMFNFLASILDGPREFTSGSVTYSSSGIIESRIQEIIDENARLSEDITRQNANIERYRKQLLKQFTSMESIVGKINSTLQFLDAQNDALYAKK